MKLIAPSILSADFSRLGEDIKAVEAGGADWIHVDVMDGRFVPNITMGPMILKAVKKSTDLPMDVHLMIKEPDRYITEFSNAGAHYITVHQEACLHLDRTIQMIKENGSKAGVSINPATPPEQLSWVLDQLDLVLVMSVNPGFGGQSFIESSLDKIRYFRNQIDKRGLDTLIQIDGGVNRSTIERISKAGTDVFVAGSAIFGSNDYGQTIHDLKAGF